MRKLTIFLVATLCFSFLAGGALVHAAATAAEEATASPVPTPAPVANADFTIDAELGYDGLLVLSRWMPCVVTVTNNGADFDGMLGVNVFLSRTEYNRYEIPLTVASGAVKRVVLPIKPEARQDMFAFELTQRGEIVAEHRVSPARVASPETVLIGVLSDSPASVSYMNQRANGTDTLRGEVWTTMPLSSETFPSTSELIECLSMLVVDGIDIRTLSEAQQAALSSWLLNGGIVLVAGGAKAATGYPFFEQWTGISAGKLFEAEDITPELLQYAGMAGAPAAEGAWLNDLPAKSAVLSNGDGNGLIALSSVGSGYVFTTAFDFATKPFSTWSQMASFWPRMLREQLSTTYVRLLDRLNNLIYNSDAYRVNSLITTLRVKNSESGIPVLLLLAVYLIIIGFGGYLLLKKLDKREWLWGIVPAAALLFSVIMMLISSRSTINKPVALTAARVLVNDGSTELTTYIGVGTPYGGEMTIETDRRRLPVIISENRYYDDATVTDKSFRPVELNQRIQVGAHPKIGFTASSAWTPKTLTLSGEQVDIGSLDAKLWIEADGMHGEVVNGTDALLEDCLVVTSFGYAQVGNLLPGQTATFAMLEPKAAINYSSDIKFEPGVLYLGPDKDITRGYGSYNANTFLQAAIRGDKDYSDPTYRRKENLISLFENALGFYQNQVGFYLFAFSDSIGNLAIMLNGEPVTRTAHAAVLGSELVFEPIGPTGQVLFPPGLIPAELIVDMGEDKKPRMPTPEDGTGFNDNEYLTRDTYIRTNTPVALRFLLSDPDAYSIERMTLSARNYDTVPTVWLYNHQKKAWDKQRFVTISMGGDDWAPYIDTDGAIYVRYTPSADAGRYDQMMMPTLTLKGEVK